MRFISPVFLALMCFAVPASAQDEAEIEFIRALSTNMNPLSIMYNREVCGYIVRMPDGRYDTAKLSWGNVASCTSYAPAPGVTVVASWHTHAAYGLEYDSEVPSTIDVEGVLREGINGWVATPGGRLWFIDGQTGESTQVCGIGCLPSDPQFVAGDYGPIDKSYTLETLRVRFSR